MWKPLTLSFVGGQTKELFLADASPERNEVPSVSDGYGVSLAYACILDAVRSMSLVVNGGAGCQGMNEEDSKRCHRQLVDSSWCGVLAALSLLLDASTDDACTESILKAFETYASLCGGLEMPKPRDAFLASLCKASLPPHYTLDVLKATPCTQTVSGPRVQHGNAPGGAGAEAGNTAGQFEGLLPGEADIRHQVVAVGEEIKCRMFNFDVKIVYRYSRHSTSHVFPPRLRAPGPGDADGKEPPVHEVDPLRRALLRELTRAVLAYHSDGERIEYPVTFIWIMFPTLSPQTLQHLVWILGLKPVTGGGLASGAGGPSSSSSSSGGAGGASENTNSVITTAVMADLPVLSNMVTRLFESSGSLSETSVAHLIEALCKLSDDSMELATSNREPSLFAVAKLLETALVNLGRADAVWRPVTSHLLLVCQHPHLRMRQWGCEALTFLTRQALQHRFSPPLAENSRMQLLLLSPLAELCSIPFPDVRQKQL